ncbi:MAG: hypothetical protein BMS9Abin05_2072 [Rhodothermia bacterium]|nr:MAG: hypothetical protein BMS9Abin05_2072 [Rhodothermia bacterium]
MIIGVAWYRLEQWTLLKSISVDSAELEDTYQEWIEAAEQSLKQIRETGINARKVDVDVDELSDWCRTEGRPVDGSARSQFVVHQMKHEDQK